MTGGERRGLPPSPVFVLRFLQEPDPLHHLDDGIEETDNQPHDHPDKDQRQERDDQRDDPGEQIPDVDNHRGKIVEIDNIWVDYRWHSRFHLVSRGEPPCN